MTSHALGGLTPRAREIAYAARDLLETNGPDALSMRRLAERIGIRAPSIYEHFRDKRALEAALISMGFEEQAELFTASVKGSDDPLNSLAAAYRDFARRRPNLFRLMTERPLPRDLLVPGIEDAAAMPLLRAVGGDAERARGLWAFAYGMVSLELNGRFPPGTDLDATWRAGLAAFGER